MCTDMVRGPVLLRRRPAPWVLAIVASASVALAQDEPARSTRSQSEIRDAAKIFGVEGVEKARSALERIEREARVPTVIETMDSLDGEPIDKVALERARRLDGRGIYILVAKRDTKIEVLISRHYADLIPRPQRAAIRDAFIAEFRKRDFDAGLDRGVKAIREVLAKAEGDGKLAATAAGPGRGDGPASSAPLVLRDQVRLNLAGARRIIAGAEAKALALGFKVNIAVVDDGGHMLAFARMDGARPASVYTATTKAVTAATLRQATGPVPPGSSTPDVLLNLSLQNAAAASGGKITTLYGGFPVVLEGQVIGAVGVGGGTPEQDAIVARGGIDVFMAELQAKPEGDPPKPEGPKVDGSKPPRE